MDADTKRNQNPHKAARLAMYLYNRKYAAQSGGSMNFWDKLTESQKQTCRDGVVEILKSPDEFKARALSAQEGE